MNKRAPFKHVSSHELRAKGGHPEESRDCSVRALATAVGLPYETAHAVMAAAGRSPRKPWWTERGLKVLAEVGAIKFSEVKLIDWSGRSESTALFRSFELDKGEFSRRRFKAVTIGGLLKRLPAGRYVCHTRDHAFALIDGVVHDGRAPGLNTAIEQCWRIESA
jgi:hypothetical protein